MSDDIKLNDIEEIFPLPGKFYFRFRLKVNK